MKWLFIVLASILIVACDPFGPLAVATPVAETLTPSPGVVVATSRPAASPSPSTCRVVVAETALNIRAAPDGAKLAQLSAGQRVQVIGPARDGWQEVEADGWRGFVWAGYLSHC